MKCLYCPHRPDERCGCRKPETAMIVQAAERCSLNVSKSFFVGDKASDLEAAYIRQESSGVLVMSSEYSQGCALQGEG